MIFIVKSLVFKSL